MISDEFFAGGGGSEVSVYEVRCVRGCPVGGGGQAPWAGLAGDKALGPHE